MTFVCDATRSMRGSPRQSGAWRIMRGSTRCWGWPRRRAAAGLSLLGYFGEQRDRCGNCDTCETPPDVFDGTVAVRKALSAILRTEEFFGAGHLIDILTGNLTDKCAPRGHDRLPTFGVARRAPVARSSAS